MNLRRIICFLTTLAVLLLVNIETIQAGGPQYVTGLQATNPGQPYKWNAVIAYRTDLGGLGNQSKAAADDMVRTAFNTLLPPGTTSLQALHSGSLDQDLTPGNFGNFFDLLHDCNNNQPADFSIVYDTDGTILKDFFKLDENSVLGIALPICTDDVAGHYLRSASVLNGRFIDGQPASPTHNTMSLAAYGGVLLHEFGHTIGLDHSQINLNCLTDSACSPSDLRGLPVMFPVLMQEPKTSLTVDDRSAIEYLYPHPVNSATWLSGRIQGRVLFSDGRTPAQGYNVIARKTNDPRGTAISSVSGFLFTPDAGNPLHSTGGVPSLFGSRDQNLIGFYDLAAVPPGDYTIEVEALHNSGEMPFIGSSSVGPIGSELEFQFSMPGRCSLQLMKQPPALDDNCLASTTVTVGERTLVNTNTDIILLGTPPRFDAWEDEP